MIKLINPTDLVYIAIDGVAPLAKIKQQRFRRFKSVKESAELAPVYAHFKVQPKSYDSNMISPGTEFMQCLSKRIREYVENVLIPEKSKPGPKDELKVILSDTSVPGEGEQKADQSYSDRVRWSRHCRSVQCGHLWLGCGPDFPVSLLESRASHGLPFA